MQAILWDIILAEAYTGHFITSTGYTKNPSEENVKFQNQVFAINRTNRGEFYKSFNYYKSNSVLMKVLLDSIINKASMEKNTTVRLNLELPK